MATDPNHRLSLEGLAIAVVGAGRIGSELIRNLGLMGIGRIDVFERDHHLVTKVDLPGLKKDEVKVEVTDNFLTISGERKAEKEEKREGYYRSERSYGSFHRQIPLPEGAKTDTATAEFKDGVLEIAMQAPERKPLARQLTIKHVVETAKAKTAAA